MQLPLSWIQAFVPLSLPPLQIADTLTLLGLEVDRVGKEEDPVFEISLTPNLGHCMSALGIARELSAALQIPLKPMPAITRPAHKLPLSIDIADPALCPRYAAWLIEGAKAGSSPQWLQDELAACGQTSINLIVDAANYAMLKWGQPLHAFDYDLIEGGKIRVAPCAAPQIFEGLDGQSYELPPGTLLVYDGKKPIAIAGIMGGKNSAVSERTTRVLLEAAVFAPACVRKAAHALGLRTESAQRFEKGVDPLQLERALAEAAQQIKGVLSGSVGAQTVAAPLSRIRCRTDRTNQILGTKLSVTEVSELLARIGCKAAGHDLFEIPPHRHDLKEEIDLIEEAARIYGYNHIEKSTTRCTVSPTPNDPLFEFENEVRRRLSGLGATEVLTCDLISPRLAQIAQEAAPGLDLLKARYCKSEDYSILRTSLLPGLLQVVKTNLDQKNSDLTLFEIGRIHFLQDKKVQEIPMNALLLTGKIGPSEWNAKPANADFFDLKGMIEALFDVSFARSEHAGLHPGRQANIYTGSLAVGSLGEVHPNLLARFDISAKVYYAELNLASLFHKTKRRLHQTAPLPQFPSSERDWTLPLDLALPIQIVFDAIRSAESTLLERVALIDLYEPPTAQQKNATFRLTYRDPHKTISFQQVESEHAKIQAAALKFLAK